MNQALRLRTRGRVDSPASRTLTLPALNQYGTYGPRYSPAPDHVVLRVATRPPVSVDLMAGALAAACEYRGKYLRRTVYSFLRVNRSRPVRGTVWCLLMKEIATRGCGPSFRRWPFVGRSTLDPQRWNDAPLVPSPVRVYEGLYEWFGVAVSIVPNTATAAPAITEGGRTWTSRVDPGIHFTDDPAFKGQRRELVAEDYVYSLKRRTRPWLAAGREPVATDLIVGARAVVDPGGQAGKPVRLRPDDGGAARPDRYTLMPCPVTPGLGRASLSAGRVPWAAGFQRLRTRGRAGAVPLRARRTGLCPRDATA